MCFINHVIPFKEWTELRNNDMETLWISLRPHTSYRDSSPTQNVGVIYHPPNEDNNIMVNHISGDFNHLPERYLKTHYRLKQIVIVRIRTDATLDKFYTNMDKLMDNYTPVAPMDMQITTSSFVNHSSIQHSLLDIDIL